MNYIVKSAKMIYADPIQRKCSVLYRYEGQKLVAEFKQFKGQSYDHIEKYFNVVPVAADSD